MTEELSWYYASAGQQFGPVTLATLRQLLLAGKVGPADLVWNPSMTQWAAAQTVTALSAVANAGVANLAAQQGYFPQEQQAAYLQYGIGDSAYASPYAFTYAGFWLRLVAYIIDYIVTYIIGSIVGFFLGLIAASVMAPTPRGQMPVGLLVFFGLSGLLIGWLYYALMECSSTQATLGKMALGLRVTDMEGRRITFGRATGRFFAKILSALILLVGFIMAAFTERKQGLHDMIAGTLVMRRR